MTNTVAENLTAILLARGLTVRAVARESGISPSVISKLLNGVTRPRPQTLLAIAKALDVTMEDLENGNLRLEGETIEGLARYPIPVLTPEQVAEVCNGSQNIKPRTWVAESPFPDLANVPLVATCCEGIAMEPVFENNDLLYLRGVPFADNSEQPKPKDADYVLALAKGVDRPVVRIFVRGDVGEDWLLAENPDYPGEQKLKAEKILGVVVAKACRYR